MDTALIGVLRGHDEGRAYDFHIELRHQVDHALGSAAALEKIIHNQGALALADGPAAQTHGLDMAVGAGHVVDIHRRALVHLAGTAGDHQRNAQRPGRHQRHGNALGFHGEDEIGGGVIELSRDNHTHFPHQLMHAEDIPQIQETARQHPGRDAQLGAKLLNEIVGSFRAQIGPVTNPSGRAGDGFQPP